MQDTVHNEISFHCPWRLAIHWGSMNDKMRLHGGVESTQVLRLEDLGLSHSSRIQIYIYFLGSMCFTVKVIGIPIELWHCCKGCHLSFPRRGKWNTSREPAQENGSKIDLRSLSLWISLGHLQCTYPQPVSVGQSRGSEAASCSWLFDCVIWGGVGGWKEQKGGRLSLANNFIT